MTTINVTQDHITRGTQGHCQRCAVALAVAALGLDGPVSVETDSVSIGNQAAILPDEVQEWIDDFDIDKDSVSPFSFTLELEPVPCESDH